MEDAGARYLRGDQKGRNHGRYADKSQELINGKHARPPICIETTPARRAHARRMSEPNRHHRLCLVCQDLVGDHRSGDRQQRQERYDCDGLHMVNVASDCGRKRQSFVPFRDNGGEQS